MTAKLNIAKLSVLIAVLSAAVLVLGACSIPNSSLEDAKWFLESYGEQNNMITVIEGSEITVTFDSTQEEVSGSAGCNIYFAGYEVSGNELAVFEMAYTEMACISPEGIMEQEQEYLSLLANAQSFEIDGATLIISCSGGRQLYFTTANK